MKKFEFNNETQKQAVYLTGLEMAVIRCAIAAYSASYKQDPKHENQRENIAAIDSLFYSAYYDLVKKRK